MPFSIEKIRSYFIINFIFKINMNLVSIIFNIKIIVYNIVDEYLHCFVISNKNFKTIELLRTGVHYDILLSEDEFIKIQSV